MSKRIDSVKEAFYDPFRHRSNAAMSEKVLIEHMYRRMLAELAMSRFKWVGLPDTIDERFLEMCLYHEAFCLFYYDPRFSRYLVTRAARQGPINIFDNPTRFTTIGNQMISLQLDSKECVPIWDNRLRMPQHDITMIYAKRLAEVERTLDINLLTLRHPVVIGADQGEVLTYQNAFRDVQEGEPVILGTNAFQENVSSKMVPLQMALNNADNLVLSIHKTKNNLWNDVMTFFGIDNADTDKKERLITSEVASNSEQVNSYRNIALNARREACDQINRMFGLNVHVEWNADVQANNSVDGGAECQPTQ